MYAWMQMIVYIGHLSAHVHFCCGRLASSCIDLQLSSKVSVEACVQGDFMNTLLMHHGPDAS